MKIRFIGIPSNVGALNRGTELGPEFIRRTGLIERLDRRHQITDHGDVSIDNEMFRHNYGAIRNWPGPKVMWDNIISSNKRLFQEGEFSIVVGGGCSVFTGVFNNFFNLYGMESRILSIDNHIDMKVPDADQCVGSTVFTLWFLTHENQWVKKPNGFLSTSITSMGFDPKNIDDSFPIEGIHLFDKAYILSKGIDAVVQEYLEALEENAKVIIHLDLDVIRAEDISNVYMPSPDGLSLRVISHLLKQVCKDKRIVGITMTEFSPNNEESLQDAQKIADMLFEVLENK